MAGFKESGRGNWKLVDAGAESGVVAWLQLALGWLGIGPTFILQRVKLP